MPIVASNLLSGQRKRHIPDPTQLESVRFQFGVVEFAAGPPPEMSFRIVEQQKKPAKKTSAKKVTKPKDDTNDGGDDGAAIDTAAAIPGGRAYPALEVGLHRVQWNSHPTAASWLAYGGYAGLCRIRLIP